MLNELERKIIEKAGLSLADFEPKPMTTTTQNNTEPTDAEQRITELEQAIRILLGGDTDAE